MNYLKKPTKEQIANKFTQINCAQILFERYAHLMKMQPKNALNLGLGLGGGLRSALTCDSYLACVLILGLVLGDERDKFEANLAKFNELYSQKQNSKSCKGLLGYDLTLPNELKIIKQKGLFNTICPCVVKDCIDILDEIFEIK